MEVILIFWWLITTVQCAQFPTQINSIAPEGQMLLHGLDCASATAITSVRKDKLCQLSPAQQPNKTIKAVLLQQVDAHIVEGYRCRKLETKLQAICGLFGHMKIYAPPAILEPTVTSITDCQLALKSGAINLADGTTKAIQLNERAYYKLVAVGDLWQTSSNVQCSGGEEAINNKTVSGIIEFISGQFVIEKVNFEISNSYIVDTEANIKLPGICSSGKGSVACQTAISTYLIPSLGDLCNLQKIRELEFIQTELITPQGKQNVIINHDHKIFIALKEKYQAADNCQNMQIYRTNNRNLKIFILDNATDVGPLAKRHQVDPTNINLDIELNVAAEYQNFVREDHLYKYSRAIGTNLCVMSATTMEHMIRSPFHPERMIVARGDVIQEIHCRNTTVMARLGENRLNTCLLNWLPVWKGTEPAYLRAGTHILAATINELDKVPCSAKFTAIFTNVNGTLLVADPEVKVLNLQLHYEEEMQHEMIHLSDFDLPLHEGQDAELVYTSAELTAFNDLLHYKHAREQVITHLVGQYCHQSEDCGSYQPATAMNFDLNQLAEKLSPWTYISKLLNKLQYVGSLCSLVIVLYFCWTFCYKISTCAVMIGKRRLQPSQAVKLAFFTDQILLKSMIPANEEVEVIPSPAAVKPSAPEESALLPTASE